MTRDVRWFSFCLMICILLGVSPTQAGDGEIVDGKVNMSVMFTYWEDDPDSWRPLFEEGSRLLYNATNGQLQLGRIRVLSCGFDHDDVDIWVLDDNSGAFANVLGLGELGHIFISQTHKSTTQPAIGQFGLVHEMGHYAFGLYDEYKGIAPPPHMAKAAEQTGFRDLHHFCVTDDDPVTSIMDGGTTVPIVNERTEFCTDAHGDLSTAHNEGVEIDGVFYVNAQQAINGESCWETIARTVGLTPPETVETEDPPGLEPISWDVVPAISRLVICADRSASMFIRPGKIALVKKAGDLLVDLLHGQKTLIIDEDEVTIPGDNLAIVSFGGTAAVKFSMVEITSEAIKDSARAVIDRLGPIFEWNGLTTDIGAALEVSMIEIIAEGEIPACGESIILISDGNHTEGTDPTSLLPALQERGIKVYAVGLEPDANVDLLTQITQQTGGQLYLASTLEELPEIVTMIAAEVRAADIIESILGDIEGLAESVAILIQSLAEEVTFVLQWDQGALDMELTSPSGDVITVESALDREDIEAAVDDLLLYIRVANPELGQWDALISPVGTDELINYALITIDEHRSVTVHATTDKDVYDPPTPIHLRVDVIAHVPVAGAEVEATVQRPNGDPVAIGVFDDGQVAHGDMWADDGVYNAIFSDFTTDGTYTFEVRAVNVDGSGPDPDLPFVEDGADPPWSVPPFVRETEVSVDVRGVSEIIQGDLDFHPRTLNAQNPNGRVTCYVELPEPHPVDDIDIGTVLLNDAVSPDEQPTSIGDHDQDGIPDLGLKFDRGAVIETLPDGMEVEVRLTGCLTTGELFESSDMVHVIHGDRAGAVWVCPDTVMVGGTALITWNPVEAAPISYSGYLSVDGGLSWSAIFHDVVGSMEYAWTVDAVATEQALLLVQVDSPEGVIKQSTSAPFVIEGEATGVEESQPVTRFLGATPNPLRRTVLLSYALAEESDVQLDIYDVGGRLVKHLVEHRDVAGSHATTWNGTDAQGRRVPSGVFLYVFQAGTYRSTGRLMLVR